MFNVNLCFSIYVSAFEQQKPMLLAHANNDSYVFASFHISEEFNEEYAEKARSMCHWLKSNGYKIIGDVSAKTLSFFGCDDIITFAQKIGISVLRLDYGFSEEETIEISKKLPIALNASTVDFAAAQKITAANGKVFAMHNFYPRPETGLDNAVLKRKNAELSALGVQPLAFIPCDLIKRDPIFDGLPTLEAHRNIPPYCSFVDLAENYSVNHIFAADICMSSQQLDLIDAYCNTGMIAVPAVLPEAYEWLYNKPFTVRIDSPSCAYRLQESREYSCQGDAVAPFNCTERCIGAITVDNVGYSRYSGEVQIIRAPLPQDNRINVIGCVASEYTSLISIINNGSKIKLIKV